MKFLISVGMTAKQTNKQTNKQQKPEAGGDNITDQNVKMIRAFQQECKKLEDETVILWFECIP